jgi:uncharacterized protein
MFDVFELTLMVNHACNLRCTYCYTGAKIRRPMPFPTGKAAIDRAVASLAPGGELQFGFFGGEPLLEADSILDWIEYGQSAAAEQKSVTCSMTTNGTITTDAAWKVMTLDEMTLSISHDGLPEVHDRYRRSADGASSSDQVLRTIDRLLDEDVPLNISMVVRPDTVAYDAGQPAVSPLARGEADQPDSGFVDRLGPRSRASSGRGDRGVR